MKERMAPALLALFVLSGCGGSGTTSASTPGESAEPQRQASRGGGLKTHEFRDARTGLVVSRSTYPANWRVISKPTYTLDQKLPVFLVQTEGPDNLKTFNTPLRVHLSYQSPQTYQLMAGSGMAGLHRDELSAAQILQEEASERMRRTGYSYVGEIDLARSRRHLQEKMASGGGNMRLDLLATEWENGRGGKALVSVGKVAMQQPLSFIDQMTIWFYSVEYVFVDASAFDRTVDRLEDVLLSGEETAEWKQYRDLLFQQRARQSAIDHQRRMADRQAAFDAHQRRMAAISAAQDRNHAAFMNRNFGPGSDRGQRDFINMINEEETVHNPLTGETYQVEAGSLEYWMDSDGNHIENDDLFYTPNGDISLNDREWVRVR